MLQSKSAGDVWITFRHLVVGLDCEYGPQYATNDETKGGEYEAPNYPAFEKSFAAFKPA